MKTKRSLAGRHHTVSTLTFTFNENFLLSLLQSFISNSINLVEEVFSQDKSNQSSEIIFLFPRVHQLTQEPDRADQIKGVALTSSGMTCAIGSRINLLISKCIMRSLPSPGDCCSWRTQGVLGRSLGRAQRVQGELRESSNIFRKSSRRGS